MPFTPSHAAAVLPFMRHPFVPVALVAGAVAPDAPYYVKVPVSAESWYEPLVNATFSHSLQGLLVVGLPTVVLLAALVHILRRPLYDLVPIRFTVGDAKGRAPRAWYLYACWFLVSAVIGLLTHFIWDALTEDGGWLVANVPFLRANLLGELSVDRALQHASSVLGAVIIVVWGVRRFRSRHVLVEKVAVNRAWKAKRITFGVFVLLSTILFAVFSLLAAEERDNTIGFEYALSLLATQAIAFGVVAMVLYAVCWHVVTWWRLRSRDRPN